MSFSLTSTIILAFASGPVRGTTVARVALQGAAQPLAAEPPATPPRGEPDAPSPSPSRPPTPDPPEALATPDVVQALARDASAQAEASGPAPQPPNAALNPEISLITSAAAAWFSDERRSGEGGHDPKRTGFNLQAGELVLRGAVDPYFRMDGVLLWSSHGAEIEELYGTTLALPWSLQARGGVFLTRFGRANAQHLHTLDFSDQHLALGRLFGAEGNRGLGGELSWLLPLPWAVELAWSATMAHGAETARSFYGDTDLGVLSPLDLQHTLTADQFFPFGPDWSLAWGLSGARGPNGAGGHTELAGSDLYLRYRPLSGGSNTLVTVQAELFYRRWSAGGLRATDPSAYGQILWRFARRLSLAGRFEWNGAVVDQTGTLLPRAELGPGPPGERAAYRRVSVALTFLPTEFSKLRLQVNRADDPDQDRPALAAYLMLELALGAHGAHPY